MNPSGHRRGHRRVPPRLFYGRTPLLAAVPRPEQEEPEDNRGKDTAAAPPTLLFVRVVRGQGLGLFLRRVPEAVMAAFLGQVSAPATIVARTLASRFGIHRFAGGVCGSFEEIPRTPRLGADSFLQPFVYGSLKERSLRRSLSNCRSLFISVDLHECVRRHYSGRPPGGVRT